MASNQWLVGLRLDLSPSRQAARFFCQCIAIAMLLALAATNVATAQLLPSPQASAKGSGKKAERINAIGAIPFAELVPTCLLYTSPSPRDRG